MTEEKTPKTTTFQFISPEHLPPKCPGCSTLLSGYLALVAWPLAGWALAGAVAVWTWTGLRWVMYLARLAKSEEVNILVEPKEGATKNDNPDYDRLKTEIEDTVKRLQSNVESS